MGNEHYKLIDWTPFFGYKWYSERNNLDFKEFGLYKPNEKARGLRSEILFLYNLHCAVAISIGIGFAALKGLELLTK